MTQSQLLSHHNSGPILPGAKSTPRMTSKASDMKSLKTQRTQVLLSLGQLSWLSCPECCHCHTQSPGCCCSDHAPPKKSQSTLPGLKLTQINTHLPEASSSSGKSIETLSLRQVLNSIESIPLFLLALVATGQSSTRKSPLSS